MAPIWGSLKTKERIKKNMRRVKKQRGKRAYCVILGEWDTEMHRHEYSNSTKTRIPRKKLYEGRQKKV